MNSKLKLLIIDVDGTLTDAGIYYDESGNEYKKFCTRDAAGFFAAHSVGIRTMVLTGRECASTVRRMKELKVDYLFQNIRNKVEFLKSFLEINGYAWDDVGFIGDDLNDLGAMKLCGYVGCPFDSCQEVKDVADYISSVPGGYGAVRNVIEHLLRENEEWDSAIADVYDLGI